MALIILQPSDIGAVYQPDGTVKLYCSPADTTLAIEGLILPPDTKKPEETWVDFVFRASRKIDESMVKLAIKAFLKHLVQRGPFLAYTMEEGSIPSSIHTADDKWQVVCKEEDSY